MLPVLFFSFSFFCFLFVILSFLGSSGWPMHAPPMRAPPTPVKSPAFKPPRPACDGDPLPNHPLLNTSKLHPQKQTYTPLHKQTPTPTPNDYLNTPHNNQLQQQQQLQWHTPPPSIRREKKLGPILCGNGSTGDHVGIDFERTTTGKYIYIYKYIKYIYIYMRV